MTLTLDESASSIGTTIQNPLKHYYNSSNYGPYDEAKFNYWDINNNASHNVTTATVKTIYDPCPPGFCVPTGNLYYYICDGVSRSDSNWDSTLKGKTWTLNGENIFFPASGNRYFNSVSLYDVGMLSYAWSASPYSGKYSWSLSVSSSIWYCYNTYRSIGFAVRPVQEE